MFVGLMMLAVVRGASNNTYTGEAARQTSARNTASAECRVLEEDRKVLIAQLCDEECCDAMATAAQNAAVGVDACLAVQKILYQPSPALELVALTVAGDINLPITTGDGDFLERPNVAEDGGVELSAAASEAMMQDIGAAAVSVPVTDDADQPKEQQSGDLWFCTAMVCEPPPC